MKFAVAVLVLASAFAVGSPTASAEHVCGGDAPQLPGVISRFYDMWNNIYRHYTCGHPWDGITEIEVKSGLVAEVLP